MSKPLTVATPEGLVTLILADPGTDLPFRKRTRNGVQQVIPLVKYDAMLGEKLVGRVERSTLYFERRPRGSRIVTQRWTGVRWFYKLNDFPLSERRSTDYETRKGAVEALMRMYAYRWEQHAKALEPVQG